MHKLDWHEICSKKRWLLITGYPLTLKKEFKTQPAAQQRKLHLPVPPNRRKRLQGTRESHLLIIACAETKQFSSIQIDHVVGGVANPQVIGGRQNQSWPSTPHCTRTQPQGHVTDYHPMTNQNMKKKKLKHKPQKRDEGMWVQQQINQRGLVTVKSDSFTQVSDTCLVTSKDLNPLSMLKSHKPPARGGSPVALEDETSGARGNLLRKSSCFFIRASCSLVPSGKRFSRTSGQTGWPPWKAKTWRSGTASAPAPPSWGRVFGGACELESQKSHTRLRKAFEMSPKALGWAASNFLTKPMYLHGEVGSAKRCWTTALPNSNCLHRDATQINQTLQPSNQLSIWKTSGWHWLTKHRDYWKAGSNTDIWHEFWHGRACSEEHRKWSGDLLAWSPCPACSWKWCPCAHPLPSWNGARLNKPQKNISVPLIMPTSMRSVQNQKHRWTQMRLLFLDCYHPKLSSLAPL